LKNTFAVVPPPQAEVYNMASAF